MKGTEDNFPEIFSDPSSLLVFHPHLWDLGSAEDCHPHLWDLGSAEDYAVLGCTFGPLWAPYFELGPWPPSVWACGLLISERAGPINYWTPQ